MTASSRAANHGDDHPLARLRFFVEAARAAWSGDCERSQAQRTAVLALAIRIVSAAIAYALQAILARWMGSFEYGTFVFVWVWVLILGGLAPLGLNVAAMRFIPEHREKGETGLLRGFLFASRALTLGAATLMALAAALVLWAYPSILARHYLIPAYLALICLPLYALADLNDCIGRAHSRILLALVPPFVLRPLLLLSAMVAARLLGLELTASTAVGAAIFATWLAAIVQIIGLRRHLDREIAAGRRSFNVRHWLTAALPIVLIEGFELLLQNTDILVLSRYLPADQVGVYFAALKTIGLVSFVHFAVGAAVANRISALNARGDQVRLRRFVRDAANWTFWPSLGGALVILALGRPLLWIFGPDFTSAYPVMFVLAAGLVFRAAMGPAEFVLNMLGAQNACAAVLFFTAGLNLVLNFALIPSWGLLGAGFATAVSLAFAALAFYGVAKRRLGLDISVWHSFARAD